MSTKIEQLYAEMQQTELDRKNAVAEVEGQLKDILAESDRLQLMNLHMALYWAGQHGDFRYRHLTAITKQLLNK